MIKYTLTLLIGIIVCFNSYAATSYSAAQNLLNKLNGKLIHLNVIEKSFINAYGSFGKVYVTRGLLNNGNQAMLIFILAHELSHARGMLSEVGADMASVNIARKVGLDVCPGARQFLTTVSKEGDGRHPDGITRLKRMGCIN